MKTKDAPLEGALSDVVPEPETPGEYLAFVISLLGSPPIMALCAMAAVTLALGARRTWLWAGLYLLLAVLIPLLFLIVQVRLGNVTDMDIHLREQRQGSLFATALGSAISWIAMTVGGAHEAVRFMVSLAVVQWLAIYLITLRWKISVHSTSATGISLFVVWAFGMRVLPVFLTVPVIAWSRVKLRRHTPLQTLAGIGLGAALFGLVSGLFSLF
jgi:membrane-associated phospholipid phosphatase